MGIPEPNEEGEAFLAMSRGEEVLVDGRRVRLGSEKGRRRVILGKACLIRQQKVAWHAKVLVQVLKSPFLGLSEESQEKLQILLTSGGAELDGSCVCHFHWTTVMLNNVQLISLSYLVT